MHDPQRVLPTLSICLRCRDGRERRGSDLSQRGGRLLADAVIAKFGQSAAAHSGVALRGVNCMSQCKRACAIALSGPDRFTYVFGDLDPLRHTADVLSVTHSYALAERGFLARSARPAALQAGILGRVPPIGFTGELVEPICTTAQYLPLELKGQ